MILRPAHPADTTFYAELFGELALDEPVPPEARRLALVPRMQIAEVDGQARGFVVADVEGEVGFVRQMVVAPQARRQGLGALLLEGAKARLREGGARRVRLYVKEDNAAAIALYRAAGLAVAFRSAALWAPRGLGQGLPSSTRPISIYAPRPAEDPALEARFQITPGQLGYFRGLGHLVRAARWAGEAGAAIGLMRLDPGFPGAFPFRAEDPAAARALLAEIDAQVDAARPRVGLVIERDDALVDRLIGAGAVLRFRMLQMEGPA